MSTKKSSQKPKRTRVSGGIKIDTKAYKGVSPSALEGELTPQDLEDMHTVTQEIASGSEAYNQVARKQFKRKKQH